MGKRKRKPQSDNPDIQENPCPICGALDYEWGKPGASHGLYYVPPGQILFLGGGQSLWARKCLNCGNIQMFVKDMYDKPSVQV